jgi:hypothetical protein
MGPWWIVTIRRHNEQEPFDCLFETLIGTPAIFLSRERAERVAQVTKRRGFRFEVAELRHQVAAARMESK